MWSILIKKINNNFQKATDVACLNWRAFSFDLNRKLRRTRQSCGMNSKKSTRHSIWKKLNVIIINSYVKCEHTN